MKTTSFCRAVLAAGGAVLICLACTNPVFDNVTKLVDSPTNGQAIPPVFSPPGGSYATSQSVVISTTASGAKIFYTMDGSTPTTTTGTLYAGPVNVPVNTTLKAIASQAGWSVSPVATASYSIMVATPTPSPTWGPLGHLVPVTLSCATLGATIVYTIDGSLPTEVGGAITHGTRYTGPFMLPYGTTTVAAMAFLVGLQDSATAIGSFNEPVFVYVGAGANVMELQVNLTSGTLSPVGTQPVSAPVQAVAADPAGRYLFSLGNPATVSDFAVTPSTGVLTVVNSLVPTGSTLTSAAVDAMGQYLYTSTSGTFGVMGYSITQPTGALGAQVAAVTGPPTAGVAADPAAPYLYVALSSAGQVQAFSINTTNGLLTPIGGPITSAPGTCSVVVDPTGKFLYAANQSGGLVTAFTINTGTGVLTFNGQQLAGAPIAVAIDPTGKFLYSADSGGNIYEFAVTPVSGALTPLAVISDSAGGTSPIALTAEPSGKYLYVAHSASTGISIYQIAPGIGALTYLNSYSVAAPQTSITSTGVAQ